MLYVWLILAAGGAVLLDQIVKYLVVANIALYETVAVWPGVFHLTYIQNTGAAFSLLEGHFWLFYLMTAVFLVAVVLAVRKKWVTHPLGLWALALITGGAIGNLIDRMRLGYVVDMIEVEFMNFAVFNIADAFVCVGAALLILWAIFFDKKKPEATDEAAA